MIEAALQDHPMRSIGLDEMDDLAPLSVRYENRFVMRDARLGELLAFMGRSHRVLEVAGSTDGAISNLYLDTRSFDLFKAHLAPC